jgi:hypothetical protein
MERIIDISNWDGHLWAEDEGYISNFAIEGGYLFSVAISYDYKNPGCRIFYKDYPKVNNPSRGKYYITIPYDYDGELHSTDDYNLHVDWNIDEGFDYGRHIKPDYQGTLTLDMDAMTATYKNEEHRFYAIIKEEAQEAKWLSDHENSYRQPY